MPDPDEEKASPIGDAVDLPRRDEDPDQRDTPYGRDHPQDGYGFAIAVVTLLLTSLTALVLALHSIR